MTLSEADKRDKEAWSLAKKMFNEQTAGLPVRAWENSTPETRLQWRKAAQFVMDKGPSRPSQERVMSEQETAVCQILHQGTWLDYSRTTERQAEDWVNADPTRRRARDWITDEPIGVVIPCVQPRGWRLTRLRDILVMTQIRALSGSMSDVDMARAHSMDDRIDAVDEAIARRFHPSVAMR